MRRTVVFLVLLAAAFWVSVHYSSPGSPESGTFVIGEGEGVESIIERLDERGFVRSATLFRWELGRSGLETKIQPGTHDLRGVSTYRQIIERITSGGVAAEEIVLLVREGETLRDIRDELERMKLGAAFNLYSVTGTPAEYPTRAVAGIAPFRETHSFLADLPQGAGLEGYLFPDTYRLYPDVSAEELVLKMLDNFGRRVDAELRADIADSGRTLHEVLTMASILEREVRGYEDRRIAADLFWRRLEIGMRLQADSTVNYVTRGNSPAVSYADTQVDSPYNTYRNAGLPPTPIGNPGIDSIRAAADPQPNDYLYFLTDPEGNVHWARTLDEHNRNKATYLR